MTSIDLGKDKVKAFPLVNPCDALPLSVWFSHLIKVKIVIEYSCVHFQVQIASPSTTDIANNGNQ